MLNTFQEKIIRCQNPKQCLGDLLFIHGFCVDYHYFTAAEALSQYLNVYMVNLPGHGNNTINISHDDLTFDSMTDYVIKYVEYKGLKDFYLMGHSMGGAIVSMVANKIPDKIRKLILCCPMNFGALFSGFKSFYIFYPKNMEQKYRLLDCLYKDYKSHMNKQGWIKMNENQLNWQLANWDNMKWLFKHECASLGKLFKIRRCQKQISVPTLLLVGKYDRTVPAKHTMRGFKRYNDKTQMYMFENSGHLIFEEETELFVEKVISFIKN